MSDESVGEGNQSLVYGGICPVCDEYFEDGYENLEAGKSYEARICVVEKDGKEKGGMLIHLTGDGLGP